MKTKFTINQEVFLDNGTIDECYEYYEKNLKKHGFLLNKEIEEVYKIFDKEIHLNEGDRVCLSSYKIVSWKCIDLDEDIIEYSLVDE